MVLRCPIAKHRLWKQICRKPNAKRGVVISPLFLFSFKENFFHSSLPVDFLSHIIGQNCTLLPRNLITAERRVSRDCLNQIGVIPWDGGTTDLP